MKTEKKNKYKAPNVTVVAFTIEAGFAGSGDEFVPVQQDALEGYQYQESNDLTGYFN